MKTFWLTVMASAFLVNLNSFGQAYLKIVTPVCDQYSEGGATPCAACLCPRVFDTLQAPCSNALSYGTVEVGLTRTLSVVIANSAPETAITPNLRVTVRLEQARGQ
jgi:hypothetical protein